MLSSSYKNLKRFCAEKLKGLTVWDTLVKLHQAETEEAKGYPWGFYVWVVCIPIGIAFVCFCKYSTPTDGFRSNIIQILAIVTGLLISSLVPFYELAANNVIADLTDKKLSAINSLRIQLMVISYSVIIFSLMLSVFGIIFCLLTFVDYSFVDNIHVGNYYSALRAKHVMNVIVVIFYSLLMVNLANLFNIIKYTGSLVRPVLTALAKVQSKDANSEIEDSIKADELKEKEIEEQKKLNTGKS